MDLVKKAFARTVSKMVATSVEMGMPEVAEQYPDRDVVFEFRELGPDLCRVMVKDPLGDERSFTVIIYEN